MEGFAYSLCLRRGRFFTVQMTGGFKSKSIAVYVAIFCWLTLPGFWQGDRVWAASPAPYTVSNWELKDRLPLNKAKSMVQTRNGYLWVATFDGLERYDGINLKSFNTTSAPDLPSNLITCLFVDHADALWLGCENGELARMSSGKFVRIALPKDWMVAGIVQIQEDAAHTLWLMNGRGQIAMIQRDQPVRILPPAGNENESKENTVHPMLIRDSQGSVWLSQHKVLRELGENGKINRTIELPTGRGNPVVFAARSGGFWVVDGGELRRWAYDRWVDDRGNHSWKELNPNLVMETLTGDILAAIGANEYLIVHANGLEEHITLQGVGATDAACLLFGDHEGSIWVGTTVSGLKILRPRVVTMLEPPDRWLGYPVLSVAPGRPDELVIGTQGGSVYRYYRGVFTDMSRIRDLDRAAPPIRSVLEDADNLLWIGTSGAGVWRESLGIYERADTNRDAPIQINAIFQAHVGDLWFGTSEGPVRRQHGEFIRLDREYSIARGDVRCFAESPDGTIWMGMQGGGLGRFTGKAWTQFFQSNGLAGDNVWSLAAEADGTVWVGTCGAGLCRYKGGRFSTVSTKNGLPSDVICAILDDQSGCLWISSNNGIFRASKDALNRCADGETSQVDCQIFGMAEGLPALEFSGGGQPSACRTSDGQMFFAGSKGLTVIDPMAVQRDFQAPPVALEEIIVDGESVDLDGLTSSNQSGPAVNFDIEPGRRHVEIRYAGLSFNSPERVHFRYRLKGLEKDWEEAGNRRSAYYNYLPPGKYVFEVLASNNGGAWSETGTSLALTVHAFFWQTWWFFGVAGISCMAGAALVATGVSRAKERRRRTEMERQQAAEIERTRIARDIHDQLGIGLTRISMLSLTAASRAASPVSAQKNIAEIHRTTAELTRSMDEIVWAVNPRHDTLDSLLTYLGEFARKFLETAEIRCRLDLPLEVPPVRLSAEVRHHVFLAFQESLHNVVKHAGATEVRITAQLSALELTLSIEDNGRGFARRASRENDSGRNGLKNMEARLRDIGGRFECESQAGAGTRIKLILPIQR